MMSTITKISTAIISVTAIFCSCNSEIRHVRQRMATANTRYVRQYNIIEMPQLADLNVEDRLVSGSFSGNDVSVEDAKSLAVANAIKTASADVLVEPIYDVIIDDNTVNASVRGHPAHYKNFRKPPVNKTLFPNEASSAKPKRKAVEKEEKTVPIEEMNEDRTGNMHYDAMQETTTKEMKADEPAVKQDASPSYNEPPAKESEPKQEKGETGGRLRTPCFIISCSAVGREADASSQAASLARKGLQAGYLWIPEYDPNGKQLYKVYVGPYRSRSEAESELPRVKTAVSGAYVQQLK